MKLSTMRGTMSSTEPRISGYLTTSRMAKAIEGTGRRAERSVRQSSDIPTYSEWNSVFSKVVMEHATSFVFEVLPLLNILSHSYILT